MPAKDNAKNLKLLPFECNWCKSIFYVEARWASSKRNLRRNKYCSKTCTGLSQRKGKIMSCLECDKEIYVLEKVIKKSKSGKFFCSSSCAATYNNTHKTTGNRRSKLEKYLEEQLTKLYPDLEIKYNSKEEINSELDIYIPSLKLAVELNGIFHYEPIYGSEKLASIQNNDNRKFQACLEQGIELVIIDTSGLKYFKESNAEKYLLIITNIIGGTDKI